MSDPAPVSPVLGDAEIAEFHERGVLKFDFGFESSQLDCIIEGVEPFYENSYRDNPEVPTRVQDAWKYVDAARRLAVDQKVLHALEQLLGRKALPFQTLNFPIGTSQYAHSDTIHFSTIPEGFMAGVWVALEDIDLDNGPLTYYPGSHKLPYYSMQDLGLAEGYQHYAAYEQKVQDLIAEHDLQPEYGTVEKGNAIIWHANLLHGGASRKDMQRTRHSQVTHYYFEGCKYYTPMESRPGKLRYRRPYWIPQSENFVLPPEPGASILSRVIYRIRRALGQH